MDVYSLINSKDIAEYLREIHYEFNSLETAWLIWKNDYLTFDEKKEKWHEVIETMPDCEVSEREDGIQGGKVFIRCCKSI